jgi:hypothetical protein
MAWNRPAAAAALASVMAAGTDGTITVLAAPPATFNPPALLVGYPATVVKHTPAFGVDLASLAVLAAVGAPEADSLDSLLSSATAAIEANPSLGAVVQHAKPTEWRNWRILNVAGIDMLAADLALEIRM